MADRIEEIHPDFVKVTEIKVTDTHTTEPETAEMMTIQTDIEHTRHDIADTLEALKEKLSPQVLLDQAKEHAKEVATDAIDHARDSVKENISHAVEGVKDSVGDAVHNAADTVGSIVHNVTDTVSDAVHNVTDTVGGAVQSAKDKVTDALGTTKDKVTDAVDTARHKVSRGVGKTKINVGKTARHAQRKIGGVMDGAKGAGNTVLDTAKNNPIPTALIGLGALYIGLKHWDNSKAYTAQSSDYDYTDYDPMFPDGDSPDGTGEVEEIIIIETVDGDNYDNRRSVAPASANTGNALLETIQNNPLPATLAILGASWLYFKSREPKQPDYSKYGQSYSYNSSNGGNKVGDAIDSVKGVASNVGHTVSDAVGNAKDNVGDALSSAKDTVGGAVSNAKDSVGGALNNAKDTVGGAVGTAKDKFGNAVSTAKDKVGSAVDTTKSKVGDVVGSAQSAAGSARDKAMQVTGQARNQIGVLGSSAMEQTRRAGGMVTDTYQDNPMAYGLVVLGIGAAVGMMLPGTEPENRFLGQKRDELVGQAQAQAQDLAQRVQHVAQQTLDTARTTVTQEAQAQGLASE